MSYSRFAIGFSRHRKIRGLTDAGYRLWSSCIDFARSEKSDGLLQQEDLELIPTFTKGGKRLADATEELVGARLLEPVPDGWLIHDYLDWQDSGAQAHEKARRARERMRAVRANGKRTGGGVRANTTRTESERASERSRDVRDGSSEIPPPPDLKSSPVLSSPDPDLPEKLGSPGGRAREAGAKKPRKTKTPWPVDFDAVHRPVVVEWAKSKGFPEWWTDYTLETFTEKSQANGWVYLDWSAAAREFFRGEVRYGRGPDDLKHLAPRLELERKRRERAAADAKHREQTSLALGAPEVPEADARAAVQLAIAGARTAGETP